MARFRRNPRRKSKVGGATSPEPKRRKSSKVRWATESPTIRRVPRTEPASRAGIEDIKWSQIRQRDRVQLAELCLRYVLSDYHIYSEEEAAAAELSDDDKELVDSCLRVTEGIDLPDNQKLLIVAKAKQIADARKVRRRTEFERIKNQ